MCEHLNKIIPLNKCTLVEIGSYAGDSTEIFAEFFNKVIAIDPWRDNVGGITDEVDMKTVYQMFCEKINDKKNVFPLRHFSKEIYNNFDDKSIDVVYIDGNHEYKNVLQDIKQWKPKVMKGGFLCGHDYHNKKFPGVVKAVHETIGTPDKTFEDTSWIKMII